MQRELRFQREADPDWARQVSERPGCEGLFSCLQCGACSGTCPLSIYMDLTPRRVVALVREGFRQDALSSRTIWLCASCYSCAVHCPRQIHITDLMYSLKREAVRTHLYPARLPIPVLAEEFYKMVRRRGRSSEFWLVLRMALRTNPFMLL
ncbi:MAG TPA: 4Fe-4S dicluster domain-containing protein, partial [Candidatus Solibacter sp.]|nr:4Fe-4S dicluster domain-containing protein [Candidatus Solibacter sp.]